MIQTNRGRRGRGLVRALLAVAALLGATALAPRSAEVRAATAGVRVVSSTPQAVVLEYVSPPLSLAQVEVDGQPFIEVQAGDLPVCGLPGEPQLPCTGVLLGMPPTGGATARILEQETARKRLPAPVLPVAVPVLDRGAAPPDEVAFRMAPDPSLYGETLSVPGVLYPPASVELGEPGWVRSQRVVRLSLQPVRYDPQRQELVYVRRVRVEVRFEAGATLSASDTGRGVSSAFDGVLSETLVNASVASNWRTDQAALALTDGAAQAADGPAQRAGSYKVYVEQDGLYRLTYGDLLAAGLPVRTLDPRKLQLFEGDREIAVIVTGQQDGSLDSGDALLFYGRAPQSRYTGRNVYWLRYGDRVGLRMARRQITPAKTPAGVVWTKAYWEQDKFYDPLFPATDGDHWYAADLRPDKQGEASLGLMVPGSGTAASMRVYLTGYTYSLDASPDHHVTLQVNGQSVADLSWDGRGAVTRQVQVNAARLKAGDNRLTFKLPGDTGAVVDGVWLDAVELDYAVQGVRGDAASVWSQVATRGHRLSGFTRQDLSLYDVTDPTRPVELRGFAVTGSGSYELSWSDTLARRVNYYVLADPQIQRPAAIVADRPSQLKSTSNRADYVLIAPQVLMDAVRPLLNQRQLQGLSVAAVDVEDIYDEFSDGLVDPEAIRAFVAYAYQHWAPPALTYVVLAGDGHYDFLDHFGYGATNYIPPYLAMVDPWWGETAADNRYAAVVGSDILPDVLLGRLPVSSPAEAAALVSKIVQYEREPSPGRWKAQHVFVADHTDVAGDFARALDMTYETFIHDTWKGHKIYLDGLSKAAARQEVLDAWRRGALVISYMGHSSWHQWSVDSVLHVSDVSALQNGQRLPVLLSMTCFSGFFHHPEYGTLDEELVRHGGGGAVASWSPSGLGLQAGHQRLHQGFYRSVPQDGAVELGRPVLAAKLELHAYTDIYDELLDTYHLFGDPAMVLNAKLEPWPHEIYLPMIFGDSTGG